VKEAHDTRNGRRIFSLAFPNDAGGQVVAHDQAPVPYGCIDDSSALYTGHKNINDFPLPQSDRAADTVSLPVHARMQALTSGWNMTNGEPRVHVTAAIPSCRFACDVANRDGVSCWLNEPTIAGGEPGPCSASASEPFDQDVPRIAPLARQAVEQMVTKVVAWTEAREHVRLQHALASRPPCGLQRAATRASAAGAGRS
jgi:hypothetical protein